MINYSGKTVSVSVKLLQYVLDFPAIGKVLNLPGSARSLRACPFCQIIGESCSCNKTLFLQNRRYLPSAHPLQYQVSGHVNNAVEFREAPAAPIDDTENPHLREMYNELPNQNQKQNFTRKHGVKVSYQFVRLTYHKFQEQIGPNIMHSVKVAPVNMSKILNGYIKVSRTRRVEEEKRIRR